MFLRLVILLLLLLPPSAWAEDSLPPLDLPPLSPHSQHQSQSQVPTGLMAISPAIPTKADYFDLQKKRIMRWSDKTHYIMVYIADGSYLPGWNPENVNAVRAAFSEWEQAMAPRFRFIYMPDERGTDIKVYWASRAGDGNNAEAAGLNECHTWGKFISKNDIKLSLLHPKGNVYPPEHIFSTTLHEVGHALGLKAHSNNPDDIMYGESRVQDWNTVQHLSERDINTLKLVYAAKPDYTNPEGYHLSDFNAFKKTQKGRHFTMMWIPVPGVPFPVPIILPF